MTPLRMCKTPMVMGVEKVKAKECTKEALGADPSAKDAAIAVDTDMCEVNARTRDESCEIRDGCSATLLCVKQNGGGNARTRKYQAKFPWHVKSYT